MFFSRRNRDKQPDDVAEEGNKASAAGEDSKPVLAIEGEMALPDPLLSCLEFIAKHHDQAISGDMLTAGCRWSMAS